MNGGRKTETWKGPRTERFVVSVDRQAKSSFASEEAARAEAKRISDGFPNVVVAVSDTEQDSVKKLGPFASADHEATADPDFPPAQDFRSPTDT